MRLAMLEMHSGFQIGWLEDGEFGLMLGPSEHRSPEPETAAAVAAILALDDESVDELHGEWTWESRSRAQAALRVAKAAAAAARAGKSEPSWAVQARAAGWKPPKGWQP